MTNVYFPKNHTPAEWREMARDCRKRAADSWERSDTDGFLSQWASGKMAQHYDFLAEIAEDDGKLNFRGVTDLDGNLLDAKYIETQYGWAWMIRNSDGTVSWFNESNARKGERRRAAHEKKGYRLVYIRQDAVVFTDGVAPMEGTEGELIGEIEYLDY